MPEQMTLLRQRLGRVGQGERRSNRRYRPDGGVACEVVEVVGGWYGAATLLDVSQGGAGLYLDRPLERGVLVLVELADPARGLARTLPAEVVHATAAPGQEGYVVGCRYVTQLGQDELEALLPVGVAWPSQAG
jgi:hypothetical protein